jgi:hypothetical protein
VVLSPEDDPARAALGVIVVDRGPWVVEEARRIGDPVASAILDPHKASAQAGPHSVGVADRLFAFGETVELWTIHSSQLGPSIPKDISGWTGRAWR